MITKDILKEYDPFLIEKKWLSTWNKSMYFFNWNDSKKPKYIIDTPPPYPTGNFHIGNAFNWCYIDFIARYKRMNGYNVMFPQGWDCHGLPTEVKVEEKYNITKNQIERSEFKKKCKNLTLENIDKMKNTMLKLGFSIDWSNEFITMNPEYYIKTQKSFLRMYSSNLIYHEEHPVNWCPRCETAIALAEVEYTTKSSKLNYIYFKLENSNEKLSIATSRPELLCSCVAIVVNKKDKRYNEYIGKNAIVPYYNSLIPIIGDNSVDKNFGTGAVMVCTFGDKQDIKWTKIHNLNIKKGIDKKGHMNPIAKKYYGMTIDECRINIIQDLRESNELYFQKNIDQNVGICWRCKTEIEILSELQWFIKIDKKEILKSVNKIRWTPEHMKTRIINWIDTMEWDWCISRQRIFATPIPIWYCQQCNNIIKAEESELPIDPTEKKPKNLCNNCGSSDLRGETDVLDTWMDSSLTALNISGWDTNHDLKTFTQIRQQGHDIIRTWSFYTILRTLALEKNIPWENIVINGMVLGTDGHKMSKSLGNIISPEEIIDKYGADALRQWVALSGTMGSDVVFQWKEIVSASRFIQKLWNVYKFIISLNKKETNDYKISDLDISKFKDIDLWLLFELDKLVQTTTLKIEKFQYDECLKLIRSFVWDTLASNYIELIKGRLYEKNNSNKIELQWTLIYVLTTICKLIAPFMPYISEEIYNNLNPGHTIHSEKWPFKNKQIYESFSEIDIIKINENSQNIVNIAKEIRKYKKEKNYALNHKLNRIEIYGLKNIIDTEDLKNVTNCDVFIKNNELVYEKVPKKIQCNYKILGPLYREKTEKIINHIEKLPLDHLLDINGKIKITSTIFENIEYQVPENSISIYYELKMKEEKIDVIKVGSITIIIPKN